MPNKVLDLKIVIAVYEDTIDPATGQGSAKKAAILLSKLGFVNPNTGLPLTKQAVLECLRKTEKGKELLHQTSRAKWRKRYGG